MSNAIKLLAKDGRLYFPFGGRDDDWLPVKDNPRLLLRFYDAGDCDSIPWPLASDYVSIAELRKRLARALYDERECNEYFPSRASIELPDGELFDFDAVLAGVA